MGRAWRLPVPNTGAPEVGTDHLVDNMEQGMGSPSSHRSRKGFAHWWRVGTFVQGQPYHTPNLEAEQGPLDLLKHGQCLWYVEKQFQYAFAMLGLKVGPGMEGAKGKLVRTVCHDRRAVLYLQEKHAENCHTGARDPLWLQRLLAGLPQNNDKVAKCQQPTQNFRHLHKNTYTNKWP